MDWDYMKCALRVLGFLAVIVAALAVVVALMTGGTAADRGLYIKQQQAAKIATGNGCVLVASSLPWAVYLDRARGEDRFLAAFATEAEARAFYEWAKLTID